MTQGMTQGTNQSMNQGRIARSRALWSVWALAPVALVAYHFGPGQAMYREDRAVKLVAHADELQSEALRLQTIAYDAHLAAIDARLAAFGKDDAALRKSAIDAGAREDIAYANAGAAWRVTADALTDAQQQVDEIGGPVREEIRLAKARALVRTGDVATGANELEDILLDAADRDEGATPLARAAREELATAYYYGARLMRLAGKPADDWREVSSRARQRCQTSRHSSGWTPRIVDSCRADSTTTSCTPWAGRTGATAPSASSRGSASIATG